MTDLPDCVAQLLRRGLLAFALLLAGCGPGTGGTGTGPSYFTADAGSGNVQVPGGLCPAQCPQPLLRLEDARVQLDAGCIRFVHDGEWNRDATEVVVPGMLENRASAVPASTPASLRLRFGTTPDQVEVTVFDAAGTAVFGPTTFRRAEPTGAGAGACSPG